MWDQITANIRQVTGQNFQGNHRRPVGGGSINQAYALSDSAPNRDRSDASTLAYFVKINQASRVAMFEAEALALSQIAAAKSIRVPHPICWGTVDGTAYIVLEWLDLGYGDHQAWEEMGQNLAALHRVTHSQGFGWEQSNTIGSTPQINSWKTSWLEFFTEHRLGYQFHLSRRKGGRFPQAEKLLAALPEILAGHEPQPSLVHGDLWSGNAAVTRQGEAVIFDPAAYFGDREVDIAMTQLFGSFPANFYSAYNEAFPLLAGYPQRRILYNLYHVLNHFNLFGGSYESQANQMIESLL
ncbi:MAG: fructosamine kinase family protein [Timaviella obliquedivisa GSE-PSE-MK23-08B]|jgi:fructosamine-3-kinase|nr:fructosamine kinase family protein [Timaviella obliquedivisa GSE-PSE-MK23-08B]